MSLFDAYMSQVKQEIAEGMRQVEKEKEEDRARAEIAAVTNQAFANCVYPPKPKPRKAWQELLDRPEPWYGSPQPPRSVVELKPGQTVRFIWPNVVSSWSTDPSCPLPLDVGEVRFITGHNNGLIHLQFEIRYPNNDIKSLSGSFRSDIPWNGQLIKESIADNVYVHVSYDHGIARGYLEY